MAKDNRILALATIETALKNGAELVIENKQRELEARLFQDSNDDLFVVDTSLWVETKRYFFLLDALASFARLTDTIAP